jgi:transcriptional regulator with XRE-family HTH domain
MTSIGNRETFSKNLSYYMEKSGRSQIEVAEIVGVSKSTFNEWVKGKKYPRIDKIEKLANYFGVLKSDLIEERTPEHRKMQEKNDALSDIVIRMQTDEEFAAAVNSLYKLDQKKLSSILTLLD